MRRHASFLVVCVVAVVGVALTAVIAERSDRSAKRATVQALEQVGEQAAEAIASSIATDFATTDNIARLNSQRMTLAEYRNSWSASFAGTFEGDSTVSLWVAVAPEELVDFGEAMHTLVPGFTTSYLADDPAELGHVLVAMTATDSSYIGSDLTVIPGMADLLGTIRSGDVRVGSFDPRFDGQPGQMQVIRGHNVLGADGIERRAWTTVLADLRPKAKRIVEELGPAFGASIRADPVGDIGTYGLATDAAAFARTSFASNDEFSVTLKLWSDKSAAVASPKNRVWFVGSLLTLSGVLLAGLILILVALWGRLGSSDREARSDVLTGLNNRRWLAEELAELAGRPSNVAVLFCDLDRFKIVNDSAGHTVGDELLLQVAERLVRSTEGLGRVARWGGDEFVVLCETVDDPQRVGEQVATKIESSFVDPFKLSTGSIRITASIGIATAHADGEITASELMREADVALGRCKERRVAGYVVYDESLKGAELDRLGREADLQSSLDSSDLIVYYQPIVDRNGTTVTYEALVRWERNGHVLAPKEFLPLAAEIGRMEDIDLAVMGQALATLASATAAGQTELTMHVNVDASDLNDPGFPEMVRHLLTVHGVEPSRLILELTEGEWFDAIDSIAPVLSSLNELGVGLAIDDFGSGYSSLGRLLEIPGLTELKIDRVMVGNILDEDFRIFLASLIGGLQQLGLKVISEGVETHEQFQLLSEMGVACFQGYLFAEPGPAAQVGLADSRAFIGSGRIG